MLVGAEPARRRRRRAAGDRWPGSGSTAGVSTASSAPPPPGRSRTSSATAVCTSTACAAPTPSGPPPAGPSDRDRARASRRCASSRRSPRRLASWRSSGSWSASSAASARCRANSSRRSATAAPRSSPSDEPDAAAQAADGEPLRGARLPRVRGPGRTRLATVHYYAVPQFESAGGRALATDRSPTLLRRARSRPCPTGRGHAACRCCAKRACRRCCSRSARATGRSTTLRARRCDGGVDSALEQSAGRGQPALSPG